MLLIALQACVVAEIEVGNGVSASEQREVGDFSAVTATLSIPVDVIAGPAPTATVTCDENLLEFIATTVEDGTLVVHSATDEATFASIDPTVDCRVTITTPGAERMTSTGSGRLTVTGDELGGLAVIASHGSGGIEVRGRAVDPTVSVTNTGSGEVLIDAIAAESTRLEASGSGSIGVLGGTTSTLFLSVFGSGSIDAGALDATTVDANLTSSGGAEVTANASVTADLTGSGGLVVHGDPIDRDIDEAGSGRVTFE